MACLEARGLSKRLGGRTVVDGVDVRVECGEVVAVLGPNGSGKTTLLQLLAGVLQPDAGEVLIRGLPVSEPRARRLAAYLPQEEPLYPELTGLENIKLLAWMRSAEVDWSLVEALAHELGIADSLGRRVGSYSGGMQRKLSLIAILAQRPNIAILDEPTSGLDPASRTSVARILRSMAKRGSAIIYTTHIGGDAEEADRVIFMLGGRVVAAGPPQELIARFAPGFTVELTLSDVEGFERDAASRGLRVERLAGRVVARARDEAELAEIARIASRHGLRAMEARRPSLEDAYLAATGVRLGGGQ